MSPLHFRLSALVDLFWTALTKAVQELLKEVKGVDTNFGEDIQKVKQALGNGTANGLITQLAEGLQQFIGYENGNTNGTPKITGGGILPANVAKHQVCNAVLNFVIRFLEGLCGIEKLNGSEYKQKVVGVINTLRQCVGTGTVPQGFGELVQKIEEKAGEIDKKVITGPSRNKLKDVFTQLNDIKLEGTGTSISSQTQTVQDFLGKVEDALETNNSGYFKTFCERFAELLKNNELKGKAQQDTEALTYSKLKANIQGVTKATTNLNNDIRSIHTENTHLLLNAAVFTAVRDAATAFIAELQTKAYMSFYKGADNNEVGNDQCAKIFLGCLPLYYQALTYIYWGCHANGGGWGNQTLANGALRSYFDSQGLLPTFVESSRTGAHIADTALQKFSEFQQGIAAASSSPFTYASFAAELQKKVGQNSGQLADSCPLSALFYGASCYFRCQQITTANIGVRAPKTIREMLYFLAALQFSPQYDAFDSYVTEYFKGLIPNSNGQTPDVRSDSDLKLQVADSGITPKPGSSASSDTLSAADLKSHLASTFLLPPSLLGWLQGPSASISDEPWLHSLFSNSQFNLSIPSSGAGIFGALSNYTYALQFQLSFLYIQCRDTYTVGCGWRHCRFGKEINSGSNNSAPSHICNGYDCGEKSDCKHDGTNGSNQCKHSKYTDTQSCGKTGTPSPLQAFLTDKLRGFSRGHPSDPSSHLASCSGSLCHVPMGFDGKLCAEASSGLNIAYALGSFCGGFNTPLRQLSEKLGCLTKRTPRTLGDLFGFTWHLNGQLFPKSQLTTESWLNDLIRYTPFSSTVKEHINVLKTFVGTGHTDPHNTADLTSLYSSGCNKSTQTCGPYLYPLTHSDGATFGKPAPYASTYLSWVLYLTDELYESLQEFLDTINGHACKGCKHNCSNGHAGSTCQCPSVVDCADVLPLLYRHGFRFLSAFRLKGMKNEGIGKGYNQTAETKSNAPPSLPNSNPSSRAIHFPYC
ncbi:variant erythrocyte surface antigen-1 family protein [Babesia caballi]|uniref:Variant erythrocyte surface antigen-1 family protein n=1 Tax=Babesia caballi TaxID=5871 RepID=A0AAV4LR62_BABCB|nr:variant erythrocyte surface antigen-1 family protein [Babesia caballi]